MQPATSHGSWPSLIDKFGSALADVPRSQVVLQSLPTDPTYAALVAATWTAGLVGSAIGLRATPREVRVAVDIIRPAIVVHASTDARFDDFCVERRTVRFRSLELNIDRLATPRTLQDGDAWLGSTSGSTGTPKYAVLTHRNIEHNATETARMQSLTASDICCVFTPTAYTYALNQTVSAVLSGASVAMWPHGLSAPSALLQFLQETGTTRLSANPTSYLLLLGRFHDARNDAIRSLVSGGQPLASTLVEKMQRWAPQATIHSAYGITECVNRVTHFPIPPSTKISHIVAPVGRPIAGTTVAIEKTKQSDATGEIVVQSLSLMRGYVSDSTQQIVEQQKRFRTGDIGRVDELGQLHIVGRMKTQINVGNEMVSPEEVEAVTLRDTAVTTCAVAGVPDPVTGEALCALIVFDSLNSDEESNMARLRALWATSLSRSKRPTHVFPVASEQIPVTEYGKINRRQLISVARALVERNEYPR